MLQLHTIKKHPHSTKRRKVVGRGLGSGHGTYSTRGGKGQTARTGHSKMPVGFEGGRQPLIRQLPKTRGFRSLSEKAFVITVDDLNVFQDGVVVTVALLKDKQIVPDGINSVKVLAGNKLTKKLIVALPVSGTAQAAIEKAGGSVK